MAHWEISYLHGTPPVWSVTCFQDDGVTSTSTFFNEYLIDWALDQCCGRTSNPGSLPDYENVLPFETLNGGKIVIKSYGLKLIEKKSANDDASIVPNSLVHSLIKEGYTAIRTINISPNEIGVQYGKIIKQ